MHAPPRKAGVLRLLWRPDKANRLEGWNEKMWEVKRSWIPSKFGTFWCGPAVWPQQYIRVEPIVPVEPPSFTSPSYCKKPYPWWHQAFEMEKNLKTVSQLYLPILSCWGLTVFVENNSPPTDLKLHILPGFWRCANTRHSKQFSLHSSKQLPNSDNLTNIINHAGWPT